MKYIKSAFPYLLAILCIFGGSRYFYGEVASLDPDDLFYDMVSPWEERMKLIREHIPSDIFVVGYLESTDIVPAGRYDDAELFLIQYGIAPVVLIKGYEFEWIVGNLGNDIAPQSINNWLDQRLGKYTVEELGFGIYIIHRIEN